MIISPASGQIKKENSLRAAITKNNITTHNTETIPSTFDVFRNLISRFYGVALIFSLDSKISKVIVLVCGFTDNRSRNWSNDGSKRTDTEGQIVAIDIYPGL